MPHKINPINFENAEGNLGISNSLLRFFSEKLIISRLQRDLSDSTVLRNIGLSFSYSYLAYENIILGLKKISLNKSTLDEDLSNAWEVLAEPIQMIARKYNIANSCSKSYFLKVILFEFNFIIEFQLVNFAFFIVFNFNNDFPG